MYLVLKNIILIAAVGALLVNGLLILLEKFNVLDGLRMRVENNFFSKMLNCYFCLSHHLSALLLLPILIIDFHWVYLLIPLMIAGIIHLTK